jgi:hypothetical protein
MCPQQYFCEYVLGWRGRGGLKADKGTIVHKVLEVLALAQKAKQEGKKTFTDDVVGKVSTSSCDVDKLVDDVYNYYSSAFDYHDWKPLDLKHCRAWTWKALELNGGMFDPRKRTIVDAEPHFDFEIDEPWAGYEYEIEGECVKGNLALKGTIDLITKVDEGFYEIVDWKTGKRLDWATGQEKTYSKLQNDPQLRIYHYAASVLYPDVDNIMVTIYFINDGGPFSLCFSKDDIPETKRIIKEKFEKIKSTRIPRLNKSWKCTKLCHQGKSTFEGTHIKPMLNRYGEVMTKCQQVQQAIELKGIDSVSQDYKQLGHEVAKYKAPGSIE